MQAGGMVMKPAPPRAVVLLARRDHVPEPWTVPKDPEVRQLVDDHGFQRRGRCEDQPPRERQPTLP